MKIQVQPIVVSEAFDAPIEKVWQAITDRSQMVKWYFAEIGSFKAELGFETRFSVKSGGREFVHVWKVTEMEKEKKISYSWRYDGYPGDSRVIWALASESGPTRLTLTHEGPETFPQSIPEFTRDSCIDGWTYFIRNALKKYLEHG
jgi:uncharacterized protein YndB with AHSA1/START domain